MNYSEEDKRNKKRSYPCGKRVNKKLE